MLVDLNKMSVESLKEVIKAKEKEKFNFSDLL